MVTPSAKTENQDPEGCGFKTEQVKKKKKTVRIKKSQTAAKPKGQKNKAGEKLMGKTDLVLMHKQVDHVAKRALVEIKLGVEPEEENDMVMDWCY